MSTRVAVGALAVLLCAAVFSAGAAEADAVATETVKFKISGVG